MTINEENLNQLLDWFVPDLGAAFHAGLVVIGESLWLYKALAETTALPVAELAECTNTSECYVCESLSADGSWMIVEPFAND